jgi:TetR/AcrR family transcriptional repressor of nem operon
MGRPQEFDTAEVLGRSMRLFWSKGYEATSLADILEATGLSKSSLYATFGDKRSLFLAAFNSYRSERLCRLREALEDGRSARESIEGFFRCSVARAVESPRPAGCMTANEAIELGPHDANVQRLVAEDFQAVEDAFAQTIERGQAEGSIASREDPRKLAGFLTVGFQGLQVMARARVDRAQLDDAVTVMLRALD